MAASAMERARWGLPFGAIVLPLMIVRPSLENVLGLVRVPVGPTALSAGFLFNILMVGLAGLLAAHALMVDRARQRFVLLIALVWGPFLLAATIAALRSPVPVDAIQVLFNYLTYAAVSFIGLSYGPALSRERLTTVVAASSLGPILFGLVEAAAGGGDERLASTFGHPNIFAFFLLVTLSFLYHAQLSGYIRRPVVRVATWTLIGGGLFALLLTGTRSAYIAMYLFLLCYSALRKPLLVVPMLAVPFAALLIPAVAHRITDAMSGSSPVSYDYLVSAMRGDVADSDVLNLDSGTWRRYLWQAAWPLIQQHPLFGHGLGSFASMSPQFFPLSAGEGSGAHNIYVQLLFEGGALLAFSFIYAIAYILFMQVGVGRFDRSSAYFVCLLVVLWCFAAVSDNMLYYLAVNSEMMFTCFAIIGSGYLRRGTSQIGTAYDNVRRLRGHGVVWTV